MSTILAIMSDVDDCMYFGDSIDYYVENKSFLYKLFFIICLVILSIVKCFLRVGLLITFPIWFIPYSIYWRYKK